MVNTGLKYFHSSRYNIFEIIKPLRVLIMVVANKRLNDITESAGNVIMSNTQTHLLISPSLQVDFRCKPL